MTAPPPEGPPEKEEPAPRPGDRPSQHLTTVDQLTRMKRRRAASQRLAILPCGCSDPWTHRPAPGGYAEAAQHLAACGLLAAPPATIAELREMWRNTETRELAGAIAAGWGVTADG